MFELNPMALAGLGASYVIDRVMPIPKRFAGSYRGHKSYYDSSTQPGVTAHLTCSGEVQNDTYLYASIQTRY